MDSVRTLALADLGEDTLERLIREGEGLFVERKQAEPGDGFGPTVASLANTLGGWLLIGVKDEGRELVGFDVPGRASLQDWMRDKLAAEVDPAPPFAAQVVEHHGKQIGVVRVLESYDTPHIVRGTGALWVRVAGAKTRPGGARPVDDHRTLIELARRGDLARDRARERLVTLPSVAEALAYPSEMEEWLSDRGDADDQIVSLTVRAGPFGVPGHFADRVLSQAFAQHLNHAALQLIAAASPPMPSGMSAQVRFQVHPRAISFHGASPVTKLYVDVTADAGGVVGVRLTENLANGRLQLPSFRTHRLEPILTLITKALLQLDGLGGAAISLELIAGGKLSVQHDLDGSGTIGRGPVHVGGQIAVPAAPADVAALAGRWTRELGRAAGIALLEPNRDQQRDG